MTVEATDEFSDLSPTAILAVAGAVVLSLGGTLIGLVGLFMWGIRAADVMVPASDNAAAWLGSLFPYATLLNFFLTATITVFGLLNLLLALRWQEFLAGGWKRWLAQSAIAILAAIVFLNTTNAAQPV